MKNSLLLALVIAMVSASPCFAKSLAIHADVVSESGAHKSWIVIDQSTGKITSVEDTDKGIPTDATKFEFNGYAYPGLIDTHNHLVWNSIKAWTPEQSYNNRFEWKDLEEGPYFTNVVTPYKQLTKDKNDLRPQINSLKYGEIRAIVGGTTMIESSYNYPPLPPSILARNLTREPYSVVNETDIAKIKPDALEKYKQDLESGKLNRLFVHIAEGKRNDKTSLEEYENLRKLGLLRSKVAIIHGSALDKKQFEEMAKNDIGMSWSPRSNIALYKETTAIPDAIAAGVTIALSPDWTISGSNNVLEEMKFASEYAEKNWGKNNPITPKRLYSMVTTDAAKVAGIENRTGKLQKDFDGDLFLAPKLDADPFNSLLKTTPKNIALVVVGGNPVYGNDKEMKELGAVNVSEAIKIEGVRKRIIVKDGTDSNKDDVSTIESELAKVMTPERLAPIVEQH